MAAEVHGFQTEVSKLLKLLANSLYSNKEVFLRELVSNASDAIDKLRFLALTNPDLTKDDPVLQIRVKADKDAGTLTVSDNGIGMDKEDLENNLGVIASSGSYRFKQEVGDDTKDTDVIGQFGVGFYSAFMVADHITVVTRKYGSDTAYMWQSSGADGYTITECERDGVGTDIIMHIKPDTDDEKYGEFLESWKIQELVRKYSDYIRFPIRMEVSKTRRKEGSPDDKPEYETYSEEETLNSMVPIWQRRKSSVKPEEYNKFYRDKFHDYADPQKVIAVSAEGAVTYKALLFIPGATPFDYYTKEYEKGLQLYSNGVLIMDKCADLLPEHFRFVRGVVDSPDLSLNISRELLQHDRQLKVIASNLEKKIKSELAKMLKDDREAYETFWKNFGRQLKYGAVSEYGAHKELLQDLLLFYSAKQQKMVTLAEYVEAMPEDQKSIFFATGEAIDRLAKRPIVNTVLSKGFDVLLCPQDVDEFCFMSMNEYQEKPFKNVAGGDLGLETEDEKSAAEAITKENEGLFAEMQKALDGKVKRVAVSARLTDTPSCVTAEGPITLEMEKILAQGPDGEHVKSDRVLELNAEHPVFKAVQKAFEDGDTEKVHLYATILYDQALITEGLPIDDPVAYTQAVYKFMA